MQFAKPGIFFSFLNPTQLRSARDAELRRRRVDRLALHAQEAQPFAASLTELGYVGIFSFTFWAIH